VILFTVTEARVIFSSNIGFTGAPDNCAKNVQESSNTSGKVSVPAIIVRLASIDRVKRIIY